MKGNYHLNKDSKKIRYQSLRKLSLLIRGRVEGVEPQEGKYLEYQSMGRIDTGYLSKEQLLSNIEVLEEIITDLKEIAVELNS
jgi:hypothetical protein